MIAQRKNIRVAEYFSVDLVSSGRAEVTMIPLNEMFSQPTLFEQSSPQDYSLKPHDGRKIHKTTLMECLTTAPPDDTGGAIYTTIDVDDDVMEATTNVSARCAVCDMRANGMYFGALVCLPCKSFFIRCTKECEPKFTCLGSGLCDITKSNRLRCQHCRYKKCLSVGMCRKEKPEIIEPEEGQELCKVCADIANGIHFGVPTCEGCKKFFRRALKESTTYFCKYERRCVLNPRNRNSCRYCRYQKCIEVGMSRNAIRMGRPKKSHEKLSMRVADLNFSRERGNTDSLRELKQAKRHLPYYIGPGSAASDRRKPSYAPVIKMEKMPETTPETPPTLSLVETSEMVPMSFQNEHLTSPPMYTTQQQQDNVMRLAMSTLDSPTGSPDSSDSSYSSAPETVVDVEEDLNNILCTLQHFSDGHITLAARNALQASVLPHVHEIANQRYQQLTPAIPPSPDSTPYDLSNQITQFIQYPEPKQEVDEHIRSHCSFESNQVSSAPISCDTDNGIPVETVPAAFSENSAWDPKPTQSLYSQMYDSLMTAYNITNEEPPHSVSSVSGSSYSLVDSQSRVCMA